MQKKEQRQSTNFPNVCQVVKAQTNHVTSGIEKQKSSSSLTATNEPDYAFMEAYIWREFEKLKGYGT